MAYFTLLSPADNAFLFKNEPATFTWQIDDNNYTDIRFVIRSANPWNEVDVILPKGTTTYAITPLNLYIPPHLSSREYQWEVIARNASGDNILYSSASRSFTHMVRPAVPVAPTITAPTAGAKKYTNDELTISWAHNGDAAQDAYRVQYRRQGTEPWTMPANYMGANTNYTLAANSIGWPEFERARVFEFRVQTRDIVGQWSPWSTFTVQFSETYPDAPILTEPDHGGVYYPTVAIPVRFPYTKHGNHELNRVEIDWYSSGEAPWANRINFDTSSPDVSIPAGTFSISPHYIRVRARNAANEYSPWSASTTLAMQTSAPEAPSIISPAAGSTAYGSGSIAFKWDYNGRAGFAQASATIQYKRAGDASWTEHTMSGASDTWDSPSLGTNYDTYMWRVSTKNSINEMSPWSEVASFVYEPANPVVTPSSPLGGYIDPSVDQTFAWAYSTPVSSLQTAYELRYRLNGGTWTTLTGTTATSRTISGGTLAEGALEWSVRAQDADGRWSEWTANTAVSTKEPVPDAPTLLAPVDAYLPVSAQVIFGWLHNSSAGTPQGAADLRYRQDGGSWVDVPIDGDTATHTLPAFTLSPGTIGWMVRTYNRDNEPSEWSAEALFSITGAAVTPIITSYAINGSRPSVTWLSAGQVVYHLRILRGGAIVYETEARATGDAGAFKHPGFLPNGSYQLQVRAKNQFDFWSAWADVYFAISMSSHTAPAISAESDWYAVRLSFAGIDWSEIDRAILYRNGAPVAGITGDAYLDYAASTDGAQYFVRLVLLNGEYVDSATVSAAARLPCAVIAPASDLSAMVKARANLDAPPMISHSAEHETDIKQVTGSALPLATYGEHETRTYSLGFAVKGADLAAVRALAKRREPVLYRDPYGRRDWCRIGPVVENAAQFAPGLVTVSMVLDAVEHSEIVAID